MVICRKLQARRHASDINNIDNQLHATIMLPPLPDYRPVTSWVLYTTSCNTQSSAPEDGRNYRPKHVDMIGNINKTFLLHLVGCLFFVPMMHGQSNIKVFRFY